MKLAERAANGGVDPEAEEEEEEEEEVVDLESLPLEERLGPGGKDPVEVMKGLPKALSDCFTSRDIPGLQKVLADMPEAEARKHMQDCADAGLWNPQ